MEVPIGIAEQAPLQEILGYLNFSSGTSDPAFLRRVSELWEKMAAAGIALKDYCAVSTQQLLAAKLKELAARQHGISKCGTGAARAAAAVR